MTTNTISDDLKLTRTLDASLRAFRRTVLLLSAFSTVFRQVQLKGDNTMTIPYYPNATSASARRAAGESYKALAAHTDTQSKKVLINRNQVQAISFTSEEVNRQPHFDPAVHGALKGEKLAVDVIADIWGLAARGRFTTATIASVLAANFDENDIAEIGEKCETDEWPEVGRAMLLRPAFGWNVVKQPAIIDASKSGSTGPLRTGHLPFPIMGFGLHRSQGVKTNNHAGQVFTTDFATDNRLTIVGGAPKGMTDYRDGDRLALTTVTTLPAPLTSAAVFIRDLVRVGNDVNFNVSATVGGAAITLTDDGTAAHTAARTENLAGAALLPSAILTGFAPIPPTPAIRDSLYDYRIVNDARSGAVLEYRHFADPDTDEEVQVIESHYGFDIGEPDAMKLIIDDALENPS